jgi:hypothetical protein
VLRGEIRTCCLKLDTPDDGQDPGSREFLEPILAQIGLPSARIEILDDTSLDPALRRETDDALGLTGEDVGTPIIQLQPPEGIAFFGPVISPLPSEADPLRLGTR